MILAYVIRQRRNLSTLASAVSRCLPAIALSGWMSAVMALEVLDDNGEPVVLEQAAERIISLAPSLTELIFAAGAGDKLVGVVDYSDYPPAAASLPIVGRHDLLDMEVILALEPDLIVAWQSGNPRASVARLKELGLTVYIAEPKSLESIHSHLDRLGILAGTESFARSAAANYRETLSGLQQHYKNAEPVSVFYQVWNVPLITAGGNEMINDIIEICGGVNVFADVQLIARMLSREAVLQRNPEVIIASGMDIERPEWLDEWKDWPGLTAVDRDQLFFIPPDLLQRQSPRALLGAQRLCQLLDSARSDSN